MFSLRSDVIQSGRFTVNNKTKSVPLDKLNKLKNGDSIDPDQLVLLQCLFLDCKWSNQHDIELQYLGVEYDLSTLFPNEHLSGGAGSCALVE